MTALRNRSLVENRIQCFLDSSTRPDDVWTLYPEVSNSNESSGFRFFDGPTSGVAPISWIVEGLGFMQLPGNSEVDTDN